MPFSGGPFMVFPFEECQDGDYSAREAATNPLFEGQCSGTRSPLIFLISVRQDRPQFRYSTVTSPWDPFPLPPKKRRRKERMRLIHRRISLSGGFPVRSAFRGICSLLAQELAFCSGINGSAVLEWWSSFIRKPGFATPV